MSTTTSMVNYKNSLLETIESKRPKTPKKWTKKPKKLDELYKEKEEHTEPKELPSYLFLL